jgi:hypothetical protein
MQALMNPARKQDKVKSPRKLHESLTSRYGSSTITVTAFSAKNVLTRLVAGTLLFSPLTDPFMRNEVCEINSPSHISA